jgi:uncharacterized protein (DUF736 family)
MGGVANQFISPSATPEHEIAMANGWGERRLRFMMEVEHTSDFGTTITEIILGYTDHPGIGIGGSIDPNMMFIVNSVMQIRRTQEFTPLGNQIHSSVTDSSHILVDNNWSGIYSQVSDQRMRPVDVFATMSRTHLGGIDGTIIDTRATSTNMAAKSRRSNASAANYMSQLLNGYNSASIATDYGAGNDEILNKARGISEENQAIKDPFLSAIAQIQGNPIIGNIFTYKDLCQLDPYIDNVTKAYMMSSTTQKVIHTAGLTATWQGSDLDTHVATILSQSIPSLLMDLALTRVVFKATNRTVNSAVTCAIIDAQGFISGDISRLLDTFRIRLEHEILRDVSRNNMFDYAIEMNVDLLGETWIKLSLNGNQYIDYVTPSFADALLAPVLTSDNNRATNLASDFEMLSRQLLDSNSKSHMKYNLGGYQPGGL